MRFAASPAARNALNAISDASIDYNELTGMSQKARSMERQTAFDSQAKMKQAEDYAEALVAAADAGAAATAAQGNASMFGGIMGGLGSIVGAIPMGGGGGLTVPSPAALNTAQNEFNFFFRAGGF